MLPGVDLGGNTTADIHVGEFKSNSSFCNSLDPVQMNQHTIFAVHGLVGSAGVFINFSNALFNNNPAGGNGMQSVSRGNAWSWG